MKIHIIYQGQISTFSTSETYNHIFSSLKTTFTSSMPDNYVLYDPEDRLIFDESSYHKLATSTKLEVYIFVKDPSELPELDSDEPIRESSHDEKNYNIKLDGVISQVQEAWKQKKINTNEELDKLITLQVQCTIGDHLRFMREKVKKLASKIIPKLPDRLEEEKSEKIEIPVHTIEKISDQQSEKVIEKIEKEKESPTRQSPSPTITSPLQLHSPKGEIDIKKRTTSQCWSFREEIIDLFRKEQIFIIEGPKGIGKSTQIPEFILDELKGGQYENDVLFYH